MNAIIVTGGQEGDVESRKKVAIDECATRGHPDKHWQLIRRLRNHRLFDFAHSNQGKVEPKNSALEQKIDNIDVALETILTLVSGLFYLR